MVVWSQSKSVTILESDKAERVGDVFVHPRDRHYLPGTAPNRAELHGYRLQNLDGRGDVAVWEYRKGNRVITRELWTDDFGAMQRVLKVGRGF